MGEGVRGFMSVAVSGLALGVALLSACGSQGASGAGATASGSGAVFASSVPPSAASSGAGSPAAGTAPCYLTAAQAGQVVGQQLSFVPIVSGPVDGQCFFATTDQKWYIEIRPDPSPGLFPSAVCDASAEVSYDVEQLPGGCLVEQTPPYTDGYAVYICANGKILDFLVTTPAGVNDAPFTGTADAAAAIIERYLR